MLGQVRAGAPSMSFAGWNLGGGNGGGVWDGWRVDRRGGHCGRVSGMRVLVIEDHEELADVLARGLRREGMAVDVALDGGEGWFNLELRRREN